MRTERGGWGLIRAVGLVRPLAGLSAEAILVEETEVFDAALGRVREEAARVLSTTPPILGGKPPLPDAVIETIRVDVAEAERRFRRRTAARLAVFAGWKRERILAALDERTADARLIRRAAERVRDIQGRADERLRAYQRETDGRPDLGIDLPPARSRRPWKLGSYGTD
jgi:hypothetical protein